MTPDLDEPMTETEARLHRVMAAFVEAEEAGAAPNRASLLARNPDLADELRAFFEDHDRLGGLLAPLARAAAEEDDDSEPPSDHGLFTARGDWPTAAGDATEHDDTAPRDAGTGTGTEADATHHGPDGGGDDGHGPDGRPLPTLGDYRLVRTLGQGAMGVVYEARQLSLGRTVALKVIRAGLLATDADLRRFQNEAEAVGLLDHPRIVTVHAVGSHAGYHFFSMKLVRGGSLADRLAALRDDPREAARLVSELARAIEHAHQRGVLHRDLKPGNILVDEEGRPYVTDFGLAKQLRAVSDLTQSGAILGTPSYMAPEQARGQKGEITAATDVYGLGAILYALLTGRAPFAGETLLETIEQVRNQAPTPPSKHSPRTPRDLETVCLKCLEKDPNRRYATAAALADDLDRWLAGEPVAARPVGRAARGWMWCRRNPVIASSIAALSLLSVVTTWQWFVADSLLRQARYQSSSAQIDSALATCNQGDTGRGLLLLADALVKAPPGAEDLRDVVRTNLLTWSPYAHQIRLSLPVFGAMYFGEISPDGRTVAIVQSAANGRAGSPEAGSVRLWDTRTGKPRGGPINHGGSVLSVAFSPDSRRLATAGSANDWSVRFWDTTTGAPVGHVLRYAGPVRCVAFSHDGRVVLAGSNDRTARLWDAATGAPLCDPLPHGDWVSECHFRPDGGALVTTCYDGKARLWEAASGRLIKEVPGPVGIRNNHSNYAGDSRAAFSGDSRLLIVSSLGGEAARHTARLFDARTGADLGALGTEGGMIRGVALSPDGRFAATGNWDRTGRIWDVATRRQIGSVLRHQDQVAGVAFSPNGDRVLTCGIDGTARVWDSSTGAPIGDPLTHLGSILCAKFFPDGLSVLTGGTDEMAHVWKLGLPGPRPEPVPTAGGHAITFREVPKIAEAPSGGWKLTGHDDSTAQVREAKTLNAVGLPLRNDYPVAAVAISPDGRTLATGCVDGTARLWSTRDSLPIGRAMMHQAAVRSIEFSPDGRFVLTGSADQKGQLWDSRTGKPVGPPLPHDQGVNAVAFRAPDSLLTRTEDGRVFRWRLPTRPTGPDERFVAWVATTTGAARNNEGAVRGLDFKTYLGMAERLRQLGGPPVP